MRLLLIVMTLAAVLGTLSCNSATSGKEDLTTFDSADGTRQCEAWKERPLWGGDKYQAVCCSSAGPEMFLRAAEWAGSPGAVTSCFDGRQGGAWCVSCTSTESLADFMK
jgi:hypothetical protein